MNVPLCAIWREQTTMTQIWVVPSVEFLILQMKINRLLLTLPHNKPIYITISTIMSVRPSGVGVGVGGVGGVPLSIFKFLQSYYKVSLMKVAWYVLRVKNIHSWVPPDPWGPWDEEKLSYIHYDISREEAKLLILKLASVFHHLPSVGPKQLCALAHLGCTREAGTS